jgi:hypothetical protein
MRLSLFILGVFAAVICIEKPADAQNGGWCAIYNMGFGAANCGFATFQQCISAVSGVGGNCSPSPPYYQPPYHQRYRQGYPY